MAQDREELLRDALEKALTFIQSEYTDEVAAALHGDPLAPEARPVRDALINALAALPRTGEDPHEMFEAFLAEAISNSPEPLQELGRFLADHLDEDAWKTADRLLLSAATSLPRTGEPVAWPKPDIEYQVWQNGGWTAGADRKSDAQHYMAMYGQDGPVEAKTSFTYTFEGHIDAPPAFAHPVPEQDEGLPTVAPNTERLREYAADFMRHSTDDQCNRTCRVRVDDLSVLLAWVAQFPTLPPQEAV